MNQRSQIFMENFYKGLVLIRLASSTRYYALEHYNQNPNRYSLVITDLCMPSLDGIRLAKRIREFDTKIKILLITAFYFDDMLDTKEYSEAKLSGLIQKPTKLSLLRQRIIELLSK